MSQVLFARAIALATIAVGIAITPTAAADLYGQQPPPPSPGYSAGPSGSSNWAGAYLGVLPGYAIGGLTNKISGSNTLKSNINGASIGLFGGVNAAIMNNFIVGAEGDISLSDQRNTQTNVLDIYKAYSTWNGSMRGRFGVAVDRFMPYATAGFAFGGNTLNVNGSSDSKAQVGYALGAGLDGFVTDRIVLKGEFIYEGFGDQTHIVNAKTVNTNISSGILRIGAAYKF